MLRLASAEGLGTFVLVFAGTGAIVANAMFDLPLVEWSTTARSGGNLWFAEGIATLGLLMVIFGVVRSGRAAVVAFAVAGYIAAAYYFTSSTSFANPAVTIGRAFSNTFAGIEPASVPMFIVAQLVGAVAAMPIEATHYLYQALALCALCRQAENPAPREHGELIEQAAGKWRMWARSCPENFAARHALLSAEMADLDGRHMDAAALYETRLNEKPKAFERFLAAFQIAPSDPRSQADVERAAKITNGWEAVVRAYGTAIEEETSP